MMKTGAAVINEAFLTTPPVAFPANAAHSSVTSNSGDNAGAMDWPNAQRNLASAMVGFKELVELEIPERTKYLPWLTASSMSMIFAPRGVGKTFFMLGLATALAGGSKLFRWDVTEPVGVLYIDGEMPLDELRNRAVELTQTPPAPLRFLTSELVYHRLKRDLVLTTPAMRQEITDILTARPDIRVVIFDNISCLFSGIDEDTKQGWEPINAWLISLRHRGLASILVHHAGKTGEQRGTSGREDALDVVIKLRRAANYDAREGCHFELYFTKSRSVSGDMVAPLDVRLESHDTGMRWIWAPLEATTEASVRRLFAEGVDSAADIAEELGVNRSTVHRYLKKIKCETKPVSRVRD